jgi:hypothetical protein
MRIRIVLRWKVALQPKLRNRIHQIHNGEQEESWPLAHLNVELILSGHLVRVQDSIVQNVLGVSIQNTSACRPIFDSLSFQPIGGRAFGSLFAPIPYSLGDSSQENAKSEPPAVLGTIKFQGPTRESEDPVRG